MASSARSQSTDPFSMHRFHITDSDSVLNVASPAAGFNSCSAPEMTIGSVEYQEGINLYRRKFPGEVTFTPLTLTKGLVKNDTTFYEWVRATAENKPYRIGKLIIKHYHRDDVSGLIDYRNATPSKTIECYNVFPTRVKVAGDFDSLSADISVEEIEFEIEYFRILNGTTEVTALSSL